jgi:hypothetical protein
MTPGAEMTVNIASALGKLGAPLSVVAEQVRNDDTCINGDELAA